MVIGSIILILLVASCYFLLRKFATNVFGIDLEILVSSIPISFVVFASIASILLIFLPTFWAGLIAFSIIAIAGLFSFFQLRKNRQPLWIYKIEDRKYELLRLFLTIIISIFLLALILQSLTQQPDGSLLIGQSATGDIPYHLSQVNRIGFTDKWDFEEPNFSGEFIKYPYFINLVSGFLLKLGMEFIVAFHAPIILLAISISFLLASFLRLLGLSKILIAVVTFATFFGGNLGYIGYFLSGSSLPIRHSMVYPIQNIAYSAMIPTFLIIQRTFILGFPLFIIAVRAFTVGLKSGNLLPFIWAGIIIGLLPLAHTHSFIASSLIVGAMLAYLFLTKNKLFFNAARGFIFFAIPLAIPSMGALMLLPKYLLGSIFSFRLGWMTTTLPNNAGLNLLSSEAPKIFPWLRYMWTNFGPFALMTPIIAILFKKFAVKPEFVFMAISALTLWILPNIFQFQVWDFDTNKFFAYAILFSVVALGIAAQSLGIYKNIAIAGLIVVVVLSLPSGLISSFNILTHRGQGVFRMLDQDQRNMVEWIKSNTEENDVILSSAAILDPESIQNPIVIGAGRKTTMGFSTWLFTHGIDFSERSENIKMFFSDPSANKNTLYLIPADYLLVDDILRKYYPDLEKQLSDGGWDSLFRSGSFVIIKLK